MIEKTKQHFCPYCKDFSIEEHEVQQGGRFCWWVCHKCNRLWLVNKEDQDEHSSDNP